MTTQDYQRVTFADAVTDCTGGNAKIQRRDYKPVGEIPIIDQGQEFIAGYINGMESAYRGVLPVVLFGDHTRCFKLIDFPFALGADGVKVLEPREGFDAKFLYFYFRSIELPNAGYSRHFKFLREVCVPKPPLAEQRRIVDILSRAEGIVRLRREAQKKAAEIIPALFIDMFGDPATNPKEWPIVLLGEVLAEPPILGTMAKPSTESGRWLDLRVANIQRGQLTLEDKKWLDLPEDQIARFSLHDGDIVLARAIGSLDHLGKAVVVYPSASEWTFDSHLMRIRLDKSRFLPEVLKGFLESSGGREAFLKHTRRSAVQFNINGKELRKISIPLPSISQQLQYLERVRAIESVLVQQSAATQKANSTFDALLSGFFR